MEAADAAVGFQPLRRFEHWTRQKVEYWNVTLFALITVGLVLVLSLLVLSACEYLFMPPRRTLKWRGITV